MRQFNLKERLNYLDLFLSLINKKKFKFNFDDIDKNINDFVNFIQKNDNIIEKNILYYLLDLMVRMKFIHMLKNMECFSKYKIIN